MKCKTYSVVVTALLLRLRVSLVLLNRVGRWAPIYLGLSPSKLFTCFSLVRERGKMIVFYFVFFCQGSYFCYNLKKYCIFFFFNFGLLRP